MKQSPYSAYFLAKNTNKNSINTNIEILTKLTHRHPTAVIASLIHNEFLMELLKADKNTNLEELLNYLIKYSKKQEEIFLEKDNDKISELIIKLLEDYKN
jgi:ADP-ribosylglycohydrolase